MKSNFGERYTCSKTVMWEVLKVSFFQHCLSSKLGMIITCRDKYMHAFKAMHCLFKGDND